MTIAREQAVIVATNGIDGLVADGRLVRDGDVLRRPGSVGRIADPGLAAAMDRLEASWPRPRRRPSPRPRGPPAARPMASEPWSAPPGSSCSSPDLAYAMSTYRDLAARALAMAAREPLTPAAYRDATGTSRKYVMAILEDLDRRAILRRTPDGHVPGPKAPRPAGSAGTIATAS